MKIESSGLRIAKVVGEISNEHLKELCLDVVIDGRFKKCPAAHSTKFHHAYVGGLIEHTAEVAEACYDVLKRSPETDYDVVIAAAVYHDYGKIWDYEWDDRCEPIFDRGQGQWARSEHCTKVYHISRSYHEWMDNANPKLDHKTLESVAHCILSHHGRPEWGSPVTPKTPEAWLLHLADMVSAFVVGGKRTGYDKTNA